MKRLSFNKTILIWIVFQLGPLGALFAQGNWQSFTTENTILVDNQINDILIVDGVKWVGTNWGLYTYDNTSWIDYTDVLPHPLVNSISIDKEGNIYVCTLSGIAIYNGISWETITSQNSIITSHVNEVVFDDDNTAYIGTIDGLFKMSNDDISIVLDSSSLEPSFINVRCLTFKGDSLCIGTVNGGLGYLYNDSISWYNANNGLIDNTSTDIVVDEENIEIEDKSFLVQDVLTTLQKLSNYHRRQFEIPMIGITGTNGKTTTKELVGEVLKAKYNTLITEGNLNNHIGVPLTLLKLNKDHEMAVIEMGASKRGDIKELVEIADPDYGIITNIGKAHLEGFGSTETIKKTKMEM